MIRVLMCEEHSNTSKMLLKGTEIWTCMKNKHLDKSWMFTCEWLTDSISHLKVHLAAFLELSVVSHALELEVVMVFSSLTSEFKMYFAQRYHFKTKQQPFT